MSNRPGHCLLGRDVSPPGLYDRDLTPFLSLGVRLTLSLLARSVQHSPPTWQIRRCVHACVCVWLVCVQTQIRPWEWAELETKQNLSHGFGLGHNTCYHLGDKQHPGGDELPMLFKGCVSFSRRLRSLVLSVGILKGLVPSQGSAHHLCIGRSLFSLLSPYRPHPPWQL